MHNLTPSTKDLKTAIKWNGFSLLINHDTIEKHTTLHLDKTIYRSYH